MIKHLMIAMAFAATPAIALAQAEKTDQGSVSQEVKEDLPKTDGTTKNPTAKPESGSLPGKAMKDHPATTGGTTDMPTAEPKSGDLPAGADEVEKQ